MIRLSVILPNFNHFHFLNRSINRILVQLRAEDELVVVDDGSTDESISLLLKLQALNPALRLIRHRQQSGVIAAIKTGLVMARNDWVVLSAADDYLLPGFLDRARTALKCNPQAVLYLEDSWLQHEENGRWERFGFDLPTVNGWISPEAFRKRLRESSGFRVGSINSMMIRKDHVLRDPHREQLGSLCDWYLFLAAAAQFGLIYRREAGAVMRISGSTYSGQERQSATRRRQMVAEVVRVASQAAPETFSIFRGPAVWTVLPGIRCQVFSVLLLGGHLGLGDLWAWIRHAFVAVVAKPLWPMVFFAFSKVTGTAGFAIRRMILKMAGAHVGQHALVWPGVRIHRPWNLSLGDNCRIGSRAVLECDAPIHVENGAVVPEDCTVRTRSSLQADGRILMPIWIRSGDRIGAGSLISSCEGLDPPKI